MTPAGPDPADARVVLVGIDDYQGGPSWSLTGPVDDAVRFAEFFVANGVPPAQITVLATPRPAALPAGVECRPADRATVRDVFIRELAQSRASALFVVWGGHGYVDIDRRRRLFYPDATESDLMDLDLDSLLRRFGTDQVPGLDRQVWLIDVCQVHGPVSGLRTENHESFDTGEPVPGRAQDVYLAAGYGQPAYNLNRQRTGLFSRELLDLIRPDQLSLLTDPRTLTDALQNRFTALRASGSLEQTPTYLWYRHGLGDEGLLLQRPDVTSPPWSPAPGTPAPVPPSALKPSIDALLEIGEFRRPDDREEILSLLRRLVYGAIPRNPRPRLDAVAVVRTCLRYPGGLSELVEAVRFYATDDDAVTRFEEAVAHLQE